ncbi:excisionase [Burkholderia anthinoferrum]|uniref:excisionase n=1 Tax=Burkholderia anthinoferrum TaxID=3090833 RepID=UPI000CE1CDB3|nr:excisionase [Burkholderia anthinoferrum]
MTTKKPKLIPLNVWAEQTFGEYAPHMNTIRGWIKHGKILPIPVKVGRSYFLSPDAKYIDPVAQKIQRMINGR